MNADLGTRHAERSEASQHFCGREEEEEENAAILFTALRFVQNDRRPVLGTDLWPCG
jgi:hypothetical protein